MFITVGFPRAVVLAATAGLILFSTGITAASAKSPASPKGPSGANSGAAIEKVSGVWVEGRGYDVTYGTTYETCAQRCLDTQKCLMLEYYRPQKKCNLYDTMRPRKSGGSSSVGIRRVQMSSAAAGTIGKR